MTTNETKMTDINRQRDADRAKINEERRSNLVDEAERERTNKRNERIKANKVFIDGVNSAWKNTLDTAKVGAAMTAASAFNDPAWYMDGAAASAVLEMVPDNFGNPQAHAEEIKATRAYSVLDNDPELNSLPLNQPHAAIMALDYMPTFGMAKGNLTDPLNRAAGLLFTYIQKNTSYKKDYDRATVITYIGAFRSMIEFISYCKRLYGTMGIASTVNAYFPEYIIRAQGADYDDIKTNLSDFRKFINQCVTDLRRFNIPDITLYHRANQVCSSIYSDYDTQKSQVYLMRPTHLYMFDRETEGVVRGVLKPIVFVEDSSKLTFSELQRVWNTLYGQVANDIDFDTVSGDMGKAFEGKLYQVDYLDSNYATFPTTSKSMLQQIRNATVVGMTIDPSTIIRNWTYDQSISGNGLMECKACFDSIDYSYGIEDDLIGIAPRAVTLGYWFGESVTKELVLDTTRLCHTAEMIISEESEDSDWFATYSLTEFGTEVVTGLKFFYYGKPDEYGNYTTYAPRISGLIVGTITGYSVSEVVGLLTQFDNHPRIWMSDSSLPSAKVNAIWDCDNYRTFSSEDLGYILRAGNTSLLGGYKFMS